MSIDCKAIEKRYHKRQVLGGVSFTIQEPSISCFVGQNGSGKTTLLKILAGLEKSDGGTVSLDSVPLSRPLIREVGIIYASAQPLLLNRSVFENMAYPLRIRHLENAEIQQAVQGYLDKLGLSAYSDRNALSLSAGEKQKLSLGRALIAKPKVVLLDEPTANIDQNTLKEIEALLLNYVEQERGYILMATHDLDQAERIAKTIYKVEAGNLTAYSTQKTTEVIT